jgi:menaquinone-dependent protoporphyrinogen oxidase
MVVLVGYASAHGSTEEIARRIGARLEERGLAVDVLPATKIDHLSRYEGVVFGSAVHNHAWLPIAERQLRGHTVALARLPVWLFSVGMPDAVARPFRKLAMTEEKRIGGQLRQLVRARDHRLFSGVIQPEQLATPRSRVLFRMMGCRYGDFRDWATIDAWADQIATELSAGDEPRHADAAVP